MAATPGGTGRARGRPGLGGAEAQPGILARIGRLVGMPTVLFVCTGNLCRSPMAAAFARRALAERGAPVTVLSAGTLGSGRGVTADTARVMARRGLDMSSHRSRLLEDALTGDLDLIVGMAREHARAVVEQRPDAFLKTFTLRDLAARAFDAGPRAPGEDLAAYLQRAAAGRGFSSLAGATASDDIVDPIGQSPAVYERCANEIEGLVGQVVDLLWGPGR